MRVLCLCLWLFLSAASVAQQVLSINLPPGLGLTACSKRFEDPFSMQINSASLGAIVEPLAGVCSERKFLQADLNAFYGSMAFPFQSGGAGFFIKFLDAGGFNQAALGAAYGRRLGSAASLGLRIDYHRIATRGYESRAALTAALGVLFRLTNKLTVGFQADNPLGGKLTNAAHETINRQFAVSVGNTISDRVFLSADLKKEEEATAKIYVKLQYRIRPVIRLISGLCFTAGEAFFGSSLLWKRLEIMQLVTWNEALGISPSLIILFSAKKDP